MANSESEIEQPLQMSATSTRRINCVIVPTTENMSPHVIEVLELVMQSIQEGYSTETVNALMVEIQMLVLRKKLIPGDS